MIKQADITTLDKDKKKGQATEIDQLIGGRLKAIRTSKGFTQEDLASKLGISFQQIQKYENGKNRISFSRLYELSNFLNEPLESFVQNLDQPTSFSDNSQVLLQAGNDSISQKELDDLVKIYSSVKDTASRKNVLKMMKLMVENLKE